MMHAMHGASLHGTTVAHPCFATIKHHVWCCFDFWHLGSAPTLTNANQKWWGASRPTIFD